MKRQYKIMELVSQKNIVLIKELATGNSFYWRPKASVYETLVVKNLIYLP